MMPHDQLQTAFCGEFAAHSFWKGSRNNGCQPMLPQHPLSAMGPLMMNSIWWHAWMQGLSMFAAHMFGAYFLALPKVAQACLQLL